MLLLDTRQAAEPTPPTRTALRPSGGEATDREIVTPRSSIDTPASSLSPTAPGYATVERIVPELVPFAMLVAVLRFLQLTGRKKRR